MQRKWNQALPEGTQQCEKKQSAEVESWKLWLDIRENVSAVGLGKH